MLLAAILCAYVSPSPGQLAGEARHARPARAVDAVLAALDEGQRDRVRLRFSDPTRRRWSRGPQARSGVALYEMSDDARDGIDALLASVLSHRGRERVRTVMREQNVLGEHEEGLGEGYYWFALFGDPDGDQRWSWRLGGHHVSMQFTYDGARLVSATPFSLCTNSLFDARKEDVGGKLNVIEARGRLARELAARLDTDGTAAAYIGTTGNDVLPLSEVRDFVLGTPDGASGGGMGTWAAATLDELVDDYFADYSEDVRRALGLFADAVGPMAFAWMGPSSDPAHLRGYRIQGADFVAEWNGGRGHDHSVVRWDDDYGVAPAAPAARVAQGDEPRSSRSVGILVYDGAELLDFAGPAEVFSHAGAMLRTDGEPALDVFTIAPDAGVVRTQNGVEVVPRYSLAKCPPLDVLVVPGGVLASVLHDAETVRLLRHLASRAELRISVCSGATIYGRMGLLDGRTATTHTSQLTGFAREFPTTTVLERRFVDDGDLVTCAGVSAGIDGALHVVERLLGPDVASHTAGFMEYEWSPAGQTVPPSHRAQSHATSLTPPTSRAESLYLGAIEKIYERGGPVEAVRWLQGAFDAGLDEPNRVLGDRRLAPILANPESRAALSTLLAERSTASDVTMVPTNEIDGRIVVRGRVVDRAGHPITGAAVHVRQADAGADLTSIRNPARFAHLRTDAYGEFAVTTTRSGPSLGTPNVIAVLRVQVRAANCLTFDEVICLGDARALGEAVREQVGRVAPLDVDDGGASAAFLFLELEAATPDPLRAGGKTQ